MTYFFGDSFDLYSVGTDVLNYWDNSTTNANAISFIGGRFSPGQGAFTSNSQLQKASGQNDAVHHINLAWMQTGSGSSDGTSITLFDGATAQCSVVLNIDGSIRLRAGGIGGTVLATWTGPIPVANVWHAYEIEVVIHNTAGSIAIRRDGNPTNDFFAGSLNTRSSANNYANKIQQFCQNGVSYIDDFLWRSDASSVPWYGDVRCYTRMPKADVSKQWAPLLSSVNYQSVPFWATQGSNTDRGMYNFFTPAFDGTIGSIVLQLHTANTGSVKCSIFSDAAGAPGAVLGSATPLTNLPIGNSTFTFSTPVAVTAGTQYWIGFDTNNGQANGWDCSSVNNLGAVYSNTTYAAFPVANPTIAGGAYTLVYTINLTPLSTTLNTAMVAELREDTTTTYLTSATNGQNDLYSIAPIGSTPTTILGVVTRGYFQKSDAGTRNCTVQLKSGGTTVQGTSTALNTVWNWLWRTDTVDPATGLAWTATAVNNIQIGPVVTA